jgi:hypothetical protein
MERDGSPALNLKPIRKAQMLMILSLMVPLGCSESGPTPQSEPDAQATSEVAGTVVDSIFPIEEEIRRFREGMTEPTGLIGGEGTLEALTSRFLRALETGDTETIASLGINPAEFAWFYYPYTMYTTPPYELSPALVWFQLQNQSSRGLTRALDRYATRSLYDTGVRCPDEGRGWGAGWIWDDCRVLGTLPDGTDVEERLFGSILKVADRFKFVSFANEF